MAIKNFYVSASQDGNFGALVDGVVQTSAARTDGWTVAKIAAGNSAEFAAGTKQASGTFTSQTTTPKPASFLTGATANAFKTPAPLTGTFAATNWTLALLVRAGVASTQAGRARFRVFKSVNAAGSSATELTSATQVGTNPGTLVTNLDSVSNVTWSPGATITLSNEYLFFVIAWEIMTASGNNSGDVIVRTGASNPIATPNFAPGAAEIIPDVGMALTVT